MTPGQPDCRHQGTVGGRCPSAAGVLVGKLSDKRKFMCWCVLWRLSCKSLFLSLSAPRDWTQSVTSSANRFPKIVSKFTPWVPLQEAIHVEYLEI
jgi:hypothetical protein